MDGQFKRLLQLLLTVCSNPNHSVPPDSYFPSCMFDSLFEVNIFIDMKKKFRKWCIMEVLKFRKHLLLPRVKKKCKTRLHRITLTLHQILTDSNRLRNSIYDPTCITKQPNNLTYIYPLMFRSNRNLSCYRSARQSVSLSPKLHTSDRERNEQEQVHTTTRIHPFYIVYVIVTVMSFNIR